MQLDNNIDFLKKQLFSNGYLNVHMSDIYPNIFNEFIEIYKYNDNVEYKTLRIDSRLDGIHSIESIINLCGNYGQYIDVEMSNFNFDINTKSNFTNVNLKICLKEGISNTFQIFTEIKNILTSITLNQIQQWIETLSESLELDGDLFNKITNQILKDFYDITDNRNPLTITCFQKGDKIESHRDSVEARYVCVILVYLSQDYQHGFGGELLIEDIELVKPEFGRIAILDFTKHNVLHEVKEVVGDYKRIALLNFISK